MLLKNLLIPVATGLMVTAAVVWVAHRQSDENKERDMTEHAPIDLQGAIRTAEQVTHGVAVDAGAEAADGASFYEVTALTAKGGETVRIDPVSGKVLKMERSTGAATGKGSPLADAQTDLAAAVRQAEAHSGGKAIEAEAAPDHGRSVYRIKLAMGRSTKSVLVDPRRRSSTPITGEDGGLGGGFRDVD